VLWVCALAGSASAQPFDVRTWYAQGQVFVVWKFPGAPAPASTVEIYAAPAAVANTAFMTRIGRMFPAEYTGSRLRELQPAAAMVVPAPGGATYTLAANEGSFAFTPRAAGNLFFAVVDTGSSTVVPANSDATAFNYNPAAEPILPQEQFSGVTPGGQPYTAYAIFIEGRNDHLNRRPDVPVLGDADKNGVPHFFVLSEPVGGAPAGNLSCVFAQHGGGGEYQLFLPGVADRANVQLPLTDGIVVTNDDSLFFNQGGALVRTNTSWFGYSVDFDPFFPGVRPTLPATTEVVDFTSRRVHWVLDWLLSVNSPFTIDPLRVAAIGHSGGGRGTSHLVRARPERFCASVIYTPPSDLGQDDGGQYNPLRGNWTDNLPTSLIGPAGTPLGVNDVFTMTTRISPTVRDIPVTRVIYGKRDQDSSATWSPAQRAVFDSLNDSGWGYMLFWDEREHGVEKWTLETSDVGDGNPDPWPDIAQWLVPSRTGRMRAQYLVDRYRANLSYPGFSNVDADAVTAGTQPDPGDGDPSLGDPWGTWGGYMDWLPASIVDMPTRWEAVVWATNTQVVPIDNAVATSYVAAVAPRRTQMFNPASGTTVYWYGVSQPGGRVEQQGEVLAGVDGVVSIAGLVVPREDTGTLRLVLSTVPLCVGVPTIEGPEAATVCPGGWVALSATALVAGPLAFAWEWRTPAGATLIVAEGANIDPATGLVVFEAAGAATADLTVTLAPGVVAGPAFALRSRITGPCGLTTGSFAQITADDPASLTCLGCPVCPADFDQDGGVTGADVEAFFLAFEAGEACGDTDQDGGVTGADVEAFFVAFEAGGC
jgi:hypothetical protein